MLGRQTKQPAQDAAASSVLVDDLGQQAEGHECPRCHATIRAADAVRRNAAGDWVHLAC